MSSIGPGPAALSALQAAQAQRTASAARDAEKTREQRRIRGEDEVDLRVVGVEDDDAVRDIPDGNSEESATERKGRELAHGHDEDGDEDDEDRPRVDLVA